MYRVAMEEGLRKRAAALSRSDTVAASSSACVAASCACCDTSCSSEPPQVVMPEDLCKWQRIETKNAIGDDLSGRTGHSAVTWGKHMFVFGGTDEHARQNDVYK